MAEGGGGSGSLKNAVVAFLVPLPSLLFYISFLRRRHLLTTLPWAAWCSDHPLLLANALFFLNVDCLFWLIGLLQSLHWMIDLYWTVVPVMLVHYYAAHPRAQCDPWRSRAVILMTWAWSVRLTHSYFRRERWRWGCREDWRFADMRQRYGKHWWWLSFFAVYVSQQVFLVGVSLPFYAVHSVNMPLNLWDWVAVVTCCCGIVVAYCADTQLHNFVSRNERLKALGEEATVPVLDAGLWRFSRHPNYFGEQLWWWGVALLAWNLGQGWMAVGTLINSLCFVHVSKLVEDRMGRDSRRGEAYRMYQKTTSMWMPWFKSSAAAGVEKKEKGA